MALMSSVFGYEFTDFLILPIFGIVCVWVAGWLSLFHPLRPAGLILEHPRRGKVKGSHDNNHET